MSAKCVMMSRWVMMKVEYENIVGAMVTLLVASCNITHTDTHTHTLQAKYDYSLKSIEGRT